MLENYLERKQKGLVQVIKSGDTALLLIKQFDPFTGIEITPQSAQINIPQIQKQISELQSQINDLNALIADLDKPKVKN